MAKKHTRIFDELFKALMHLSDTAVTTFINALFSASHPPGSTVHQLNTELPHQGWGKIIADMVITITEPINDSANTLKEAGPLDIPASVPVTTYLIEAQIKDDDTMALRVFQYAFAIGRQEAQKSKPQEDGIITIPLPQARVIYLEPTSHTPDVLHLRLESPDGAGGAWDYRVKTLKVLDHSIRELEELNLALLLPFYLLKIRKRLKRAKTGVKRQQLAKELDHINAEMIGAYRRGEAAGQITVDDRTKLFELTKQLHDDLYLGYTEFKEAGMALDLSRIEAIDREAAQREELRSKCKELQLERDELHSELEFSRMEALKRVEAVERERQEALRRAEAVEYEKQEMARKFEELERKIRELEDQVKS
jgi:hypothetical protein